MRGCDLRCAVAFWGIGATDRLFPSGVPEDARIVCELSIGSTNPEVLRAMGAPENKRLKHLEQLHAKVYISDQGAIVCSANASDNGIGFVEVAGLVEAGVLIEPGTKAFLQVEGWFGKFGTAAAMWTRRRLGGRRRCGAADLARETGRRICRSLPMRLHCWAR